MPGVRMCKVCRGSKQKCAPTDRSWIAGGRQDKCERCTQFNHECGPHEYPPQRSRASRTSSAKGSQSSGSSSKATDDTTPPSDPQRMEARNDTLEVKQELRRRLKGLDMQVETTKKLQVALDHLVQNGRQGETIYAELLSSRNANVRILTLMPAQAEVLAERLAGWGEIEAAEAAYIRILDAYRAFRALDIEAWLETRILLKNLADMLWETGESVRAENFIWEALNLRGVQGKALPTDLDFLKRLARSLPKTSVVTSESIQSIDIPCHLSSSPFPPLQWMMQSSFASTVSGSPFHKGEFPETSITSDGPILGGIEAIMEFIRVLPIEALETRDIYGRSPFYMASSLGMEGLGRGILLRLAEVSGPHNKDHLNNRDLMGQTVLGASILGGCSLQYIRFLIEGGAHVDPDPLAVLPFTPLQAAALLGSLDIVCLLMGNGAEVSRVYPGNDTPMALAEQNHHADVIEQLSKNTTVYSTSAFDLGWNPG